MPRRRQSVRKARLLKPLSPTTRRGRPRGRPGPRRLTAPWRSKRGATVASCCWPGVSTTVSGWPLPSARRCTFVLNPPWLRPRASVAGSPPLPPPHVGGRGSLYRPDSGRSNRASLPRPLGAGRPPAPDPTRRRGASAESACARSPRARTGRAGPATARRSAASTRYRSRCAGEPCWAAPSAVAQAAATAPAAPIPRQ
jgi:hypothetical protein